MARVVLPTFIIRIEAYSLLEALTAESHEIARILGDDLRRDLMGRLPAM